MKLFVELQKYFLNFFLFSIEFYDHAISLDNNLCDAFVAKGCALANLVTIFLFSNLFKFF